MSGILEKVRFNEKGLVPAVAQDIRTDEVLMLAYMNEEALKKTVETGLAHYYSRSRQTLWLKGETSGHFQKVRSIGFDCDFDAILLKVEQTGPACHTGHHSCFFTRLEADELRNRMKGDASGCSGKFNGEAEKTDVSCGKERPEESDVSSGTGTEVNEAARNELAVNEAAGKEPIGTEAGGTEPAGSETDGKIGPEVLQKVFDIIADRLKNPREGSYTNYLFAKGLDKILKKIGEEASEVVIASKNGSRDEIKGEIADLMYHIMVLLAERGMSLGDVYGELAQRF